MISNFLLKYPSPAGFYSKKYN